MSFLTSWLVSLFVRWMRNKRGVVVPDCSAVMSDTDGYEIADAEMVKRYSPVRTPPVWPRGASLGAEMHDGRGFGPDSVKQPEMLSITLRRDQATGKIYDCSGRELVSVEIRGQGRRDFWSGSTGILQALSSEILAGQMITLLLVDNVAFAESADSCRIGLHFLDATCVWVESMGGFGEVPLDAELAVA